VITTNKGGGRAFVRSPLFRAACLALACGAACSWAGAFELRLGPELWTQPWRLWTSHLVHANATHFLLDVGTCVALVVLGAPLRSFLWLAPTVALGVAATRPDLATYVGLSGVLHGWFVLVAVRRIESRPARTALILGVVAKAAWEVAAGTTSLGGFDMGAQPIPEAHLIGTLSALLACWALAAAGRNSRDAGEKPLPSTLNKRFFPASDTECS